MRSAYHYRKQRYAVSVSKADYLAAATRHGHDSIMSLQTYGTCSIRLKSEDSITGEGIPA